MRAVCDLRELYELLRNIDFINAVCVLFNRSNCTASANAVYVFVIIGIHFTIARIANFTNSLFLTGSLTAGVRGLLSRHGAVVGIDCRGGLRAGVIAGVDLRAAEGGICVVLGVGVGGLDVLPPDLGDHAVLACGLACLQQVCHLAACELGGSLGLGRAGYIAAIDAAVGSAAQIIAVCDGAFRRHIADHAADNVVVAGDGATVIAALDRAEVIADHAADIEAAADRAGVIAVLDRVGVIADHAADNAAVAADRAGIIAVPDRASDVTSDHAADTLAAAQIRINDTDILYCAAVHIAEQANVACGAVVKVHAGDGLIVTVKGAVVAICVGADGSPCAEGIAVGDSACIVIGQAAQQLLIDRDILGQNGIGRPILCHVAVATIDHRRKPVELACVGNLVVAVGVGIYSRLIAAADGTEAGSFVEGVSIGIQFTVARTADSTDCLSGAGSRTAGVILGNGCAAAGVGCGVLCAALDRCVGLGTAFMGTHCLDGDGAAGDLIGVGGELDHLIVALPVCHAVGKHSVERFITGNADRCQTVGEGDTFAQRDSGICAANNITNITADAAVAKDCYIAGAGATRGYALPRGGNLHILQRQRTRCIHCIQFHAYYSGSSVVSYTHAQLVARFDLAAGHGADNGYVCALHGRVISIDGKSVIIGGGGHCLAVQVNGKLTGGDVDGVGKCYAIKKLYRGAAGALGGGDGFCECLIVGNGFAVCQACRYHGAADGTEAGSFVEGVSRCFDFVTAVPSCGVL